MDTQLQNACVFILFLIFLPLHRQKKSINLAFKQEKHDTTSKLLFTSLTLPSMNSELQDSINWMKAHAYISDRQPFFIIRVWSNFFSDIFFSQILDDSHQKPWRPQQKAVPHLQNWLIHKSTDWSQILVFLVFYCLSVFSFCQFFVIWFICKVLINWLHAVPLINSWRR